MVACQIVLVQYNTSAKFRSVRKAGNPPIMTPPQMAPPTSRPAGVGGAIPLSGVDHFGDATHRTASQNGTTTSDTVDRHPAAREEGSATAMPDPKHARKGGRRLAYLLYVAVLLIAGYGQATGLIALFHWPLLFAIPAVFVLELFAVVFAHEAEHRRSLGEGGYAPLALAVSFAVFAVNLNWFGHVDQDRRLAVFFAGLSAAGFVAYLILSGARRRDALRAAGKMAQPTPVYGLGQWITDPKITNRAKAIAMGNPRLNDRAKSLAVAREEQRTADRHKAIYGVVRADMDEAFGPKVAELVATVADPERLAAEIEKAVDWQGVASKFAARVDPTRLAAAIDRVDARRARDRAAQTAPDGAHTAPRAPRTKRTDSAPHRTRTARTVRTPNAPEGAPPERTGARPDTAPRGTEVRTARTAPDGWWTRERERFYTDIYAPRLDATGVEVGGAELTAGLGMTAPGAARTARTERLRVRYADDVVRGARAPHGALPDEVAGLIAAKRTARMDTGEIERITDGQERTP